MIINGIELKNIMLNKLKNELKFINKKLGLAVIQIGSDSSSNIYIKQKEKLCYELGYNFIYKNFSIDSKEDEIIEEIKLLNEDKNIDGILVQLPIPKNFNSNKILNSISPYKDVDGLTYINSGKLIQDESGITPCTAMGIIDLLEYNNITIEGKNVAVIGRSILVGKPIFNLLTNRNATVTLCHSKTNHIENITKNADIIVIAIGKKGFLKRDMIKDGAIVIDVGINVIDGKIYGDTDFENIKDKCSYITPTPGGIGPLTIAELGYNVYKAYKKELEN